MDTSETYIRKIAMSISNFFFKLLFSGQWEHMGHLVDDVIRLESKLELDITTGSESYTRYI